MASHIQSRVIRFEDSPEGQHNMPLAKAATDDSKSSEVGRRGPLAIFPPDQLDDPAPHTT
jgi:hypothetical protein